MQLQQKSKQQQQKKEPRDEGKSICSISDSLMPKYKEPAVRTSSAHTRTPHSLRHLGSETAHPAELPIPFRNYINGFQDIITSTLPTHCCTPAPSPTSLRANWLYDSSRQLWARLAVWLSSPLDTDSDPSPGTEQLSNQSKEWGANFQVFNHTMF